MQNLDESPLFLFVLSKSPTTSMLSFMYPPTCLFPIASQDMHLSSVKQHERLGIRTWTLPDL